MKEIINKSLKGKNKAKLTCPVTHFLMILLYKAKRDSFMISLQMIELK